MYTVNNIPSQKHCSTINKKVHTGHLKGALFWSPFKEFKVTNQPNQIYIALQACGCIWHSVCHILHFLYDKQKRALFRWPVKLCAAISIEASIAIPIFLFAFLEILSLLNALNVYSEMLYDIKSTIDPISVYAYAYDVFVDEEKIGIEDGIIAPKVLPEGYLRAQIKNDCLSVFVKYEVEPTISLAGVGIPLQHYYFVRMWTGYEDNETFDSGDIVYITPSGSVYHIYRDCSHLQLSICSIQKSKLKDARNEYGECYRNCPMCLECIEKEDRLDNFYITQKGNKYHGDLDCSALKRTVVSIPITEIGDRRLCMRCEERKAK